MYGGKHKQPLGYTFVEVMIFMAITGLMFLMAASFISGKQANVEFKQSMSEIDTQIKTVVNEVANGEFNSLGPNRCSAPAGGGAPVIDAVVTTNKQGENGGVGGCVFLGKVLQFNADNDPTKYYTYTIAGRQVDAATGSPIMKFGPAQPIVADNSGGAPRSTADLTQTSSLKSGLELVKILECTAVCSGASPTYNPIGDFGFFGSFGGYNSFGGSNSTPGAQSVVTAVIPNTVSGESRDDAVTELNNNSNWIPIDTSPNAYVIGGGRTVVLCFKNGSKYGSLTIGGSNGQQFSTDLQIGSGVPDICTS